MVFAILPLPSLVIDRRESSAIEVAIGCHTSMSAKSVTMTDAPESFTALKESIVSVAALPIGEVGGS